MIIPLKMFPMDFHADVRPKCGTAVHILLSKHTQHVRQTCTKFHNFIKNKNKKNVNQYNCSTTRRLPYVDYIVTSS